MKLTWVVVQDIPSDWLWVVKSDLSGVSYRRIQRCDIDKMLLKITYISLGILFFTSLMIIADQEMID